ncbi:MAG TPA: nucleotidyltransferase domain-containing protein [Candidatus Babeliales bacterium]|nr:nucleotidyltransferase domain-containing protein [Candidatus Babeliales bacterium]
MVTQETLEEVKKRLIKAYNPVSIYLFGSYAWGTPTEDSDLDLLIVVDQSQEKSYQRPLSGYDALFGMNIAKDIIVYTKAEFDAAAENSTTLSFKVKQGGKLIYARA